MSKRKEVNPEIWIEMMDLMELLSTELAHDNYLLFIEIVSDCQTIEDLWKKGETKREEIFGDNSELFYTTLETYTGLILHLGSASDAYQTLQTIINPLMGDETEPLH